MQLVAYSLQLVAFSLQLLTRFLERIHAWLLSGPASILGEPIPAGVLTLAAKLSVPPAIIPAAEILPENLPTAWQDDETIVRDVVLRRTRVRYMCGRAQPDCRHVAERSALIGFGILQTRSFMGSIGYC